LQAEHELSMLQFQNCKKESRKEENVLKKLGEIVAFLKKRQVIKKHSDEQILINDLRTLLKVADLQLIPEVLKAMNYPRPPSKKTDPYILYTWLVLCEGLAVPNEDDRPFDPAALESEAGQLEQLTNTPANVAALRQTLSACGIRLHLLPRFQKLQVRGFINRNQKGTYVLIMPRTAKSAKQFKEDFYNFLEQIKTGKVKENLVEYDSGGSDP